MSNAGYPTRLAPLSSHSDHVLDLPVRLSRCLEPLLFYGLLTFVSSDWPSHSLYHARWTNPRLRTIGFPGNCCLQLNAPELFPAKQSTTHRIPAFLQFWRLDDCWRFSAGPSKTVWMHPLNPFLRAFFRSTVPGQCIPVENHVSVPPVSTRIDRSS